MTDEAAAPSRAKWTKLIVVVVVFIGVLLLWQQYQERRHRDAALSTMVVAFQKQNSLTVFRAQVATVVTNSISRMGFLPAEQTAIIPATVEYRLDLSKMKASDLVWDPRERRMLVTLPPLSYGSPNLDETKARYYRKGLLISGNTQDELRRMNSKSATKEANLQARNPEMMKLARAAAREAMALNVSMPLKAAGFDDASVAVRFADDPKDDPSYIDQSRSYNEVLEERARQGQGTR